MFFAAESRICLKMENGAFNCQLRLACNNQETTTVQNLQSIHNGGEQCQGNGDITNGEDNIMEINGDDPCQQNGGITTGKDNVMDINRDGVNGIVEDEGLKVEAGAVIDAGDHSYRIIRLIGNVCQLIFDQHHKNDVGIISHLSSNLNLLKGG